MNINKDNMLLKVQSFSFCVHNILLTVQSIYICIKTVTTCAFFPLCYKSTAENSAMYGAFKDQEKKVNQMVTSWCSLIYFSQNQLFELLYV